MKTRLLARPQTGASVTLAALGLMATGCFDSAPRTLITDLRFVAGVVEPAELVPGGNIQVQFRFADDTTASPSELRYLLLECSRYEGFGDCLELADAVLTPGGVDEEGNITDAGYLAYFVRYVKTGTVEEGVLTSQLPTAYPLSFLLTENGTPGNVTSETPSFAELEGTVQLLLCPDEVCGSLLSDIEALQEGTLAPEAVEGGFYAFFQYVTLLGMLEDYPMETTALATKGFLMSRRSAEALNHNPLMTDMTVECEAVAASEQLGGAGVSCIAQVAVDPLSYEVYTIYGEDGTAEEVTETLSARWFSMAGEPSDAEDGGGPGGPPGTTDEPAEETPAPLEFSRTFLLTEAEATESVTFWGVVVDERQGQAWMEWSGIPMNSVARTRHP